MSFNKEHVWVSRYDDKGFSVEIKAWNSKYTGYNNFMWNIYVHIYERNPLFTMVDTVMNLSFHGGVSFDEITTTSPAKWIIHEWQKERRTLTVGCDYNHFRDDYFNNCDPEDGIPDRVLLGAKNLINEVLGLLEEIK